MIANLCNVFYFIVPEYGTYGVSGGQEDVFGITKVRYAVWPNYALVNINPSFFPSRENSP